MYLQAAALERLKASIEGARMSLSTQVGDGGQADAITGDGPVEPPSAGIPMPSSTETSTEASTGNRKTKGKKQVSE